MGLQQVVKFMLAASLASLVLAGCSSGVTAGDSAETRKEFSQENYEKAMIAAGRGEELKREKEAAAQRGEQ